MDYSALASKGHELISRFGLKVSLTRAGATVGSGVGVFIQSKSEDASSPSSSVLAQTSQNARTLLLSGLIKAPLVGDVLTSDKQSWTVQSVEITRPTNVTLLYRVEVI